MRKKNIRKRKKNTTQKGMEEREQKSATIRYSKVDPLQSASKATMQNNTRHKHQRGPTKPLRPPPRSHTVTEEPAGQLRLS